MEGMRIEEGKIVGWANTNDEIKIVLCDERKSILQPAVVH
jgi:hypothetical protein